jgi:PfaB family protein
MEKALSKSCSNSAMAIVGMAARFGSCNNLDAFDRSIYDGSQHFIPLPDNRWNRNKFNQEEAPIGAFIKDSESFLFNTSFLRDEQLNTEQLLLVNVVHGALKRSGIAAGAKVAVLIAIGTAPSEDDLAKRISSKWNFTGPSMLLPKSENATFRALEIAQQLLSRGEVEAVLVGASDWAGSYEDILLRCKQAPINTGIPTLGYDQQANGWMVGEGAGAIVLKLYEEARLEKNPVYAVIDAIGFAQFVRAVDSIPPAPSAAAVTSVCRKALDSAGISAQDVGYLEVSGSGIQEEDGAEICGLTQAYATADGFLSCGLGGVKANIGHAHGASGMASLIKTALCIHHRYIPAVPKWSGVKDPVLWQETPFYIASESRPWLLTKATKRVAAINSLGHDGTYAHVVLSEALEAPQNNSNPRPRINSSLEQMSLYLFPIAADHRVGLEEQVQVLEQTLEESADLSSTAYQTFRKFQQHGQGVYALAILGRNRNELTRECQRAMQGIGRAFEQGEDWKTPIGSYFTAKPLAAKGQLAYVYPGAFGAYLGLGRTLFRLFPKVYNYPLIASTDSRLAHRVDRLLYPKSLNKLSFRELEALEKQLTDDVLGMLDAEIAIAGLLTGIMKDYFQVQPQTAFGCSLGEISMVCAQGLWADFNQGSHALNASSLFKTRLTGPKNAVRDYWGLPQLQGDYEELWGTYVLIHPASEAINYIEGKERIYVTQINTPKEVVIAGDIAVCQRVIKALGCDSFRAPLNHAIHCEAMRSEYEEIASLSKLPIQTTPNTTIYSSAFCKPIAPDSESIAHSIAQGLCQTLDFPGLVNRVYEDGARIFIESGASSICSRWISEILGEKEHVVIPLNRRGMDDYTSIVRALAQLISHRVPADLSQLYPQSESQESDESSILEPLENSKHLGSSKAALNAHAAFLRSRHESLQQIAEIINMQISISKRLEK